MPSIHAAEFREAVESLVPSGVAVRAGAIEEAGTRIHRDEEALVAQSVAHRRREFAAGRTYARAALSAIGHDAGDEPLLWDADRVPRWPPGIVGSISHCRDWCAVVVARATEYGAIGVDIEDTLPPAPELRSVVCSDAELRELPSAAGDDGERWIRVIFSAKEAFYKAYFPLNRVRLDFQDLRVRLFPESGEFSAALVREAAPPLQGQREHRGRFATTDRWVASLIVVPSR